MIFKFMISLIDGHSDYVSRYRKPSYITGLKKYQLSVTFAVMGLTEGTEIKSGSWIT
jgi:hypothetical protein